MLGTSTVWGHARGFAIAAAVAALALNAGATPDVANAVTAAGAPIIGISTGGAGSATARWSAPVTNGGPAITAYHVRLVSSAADKHPVKLWNVASNLNTVTVTGLTSGWKLQFQVQAYTAAGISTSAFSNVFTVLPWNRTGTSANPPGVGAYWSSRLAGHNQVVIADGINNSTNGRVSVTPWTWTANGWVKGPADWAWGGSAGWGKTRQGDGKSPIGVFSLHDAGGYYGNPGTRMPYWYSPRGFSKIGTNGTRVFSYVLAIGYNHVTGTSPLSASTPGQYFLGNQIWLHENGGGYTSGCIGTTRTLLVYILRWINPASSPVILMGPHSQLTRTS